MPYLEDFSYAYPKTYRTIICGLALAVTVSSVALMPENAATKAMGLIELRARSEGLLQAAYWQGREYVYRRSTLSPQVIHGFIIGIDQYGHVIISRPKETKFTASSFELASTKILNAQAADSFARRYRKANARIEIYGRSAAIWIDGSLFNIELIKAGLAKPEGSPETNITNKAFAEYYWRVTRNGAST